MNLEWKHEQGATNECLLLDEWDCFVSYNPKTVKTDADALNRIAEQLGKKTVYNNGGTSETAFVIRGVMEIGNTFIILDGDHRDEFLEAARKDGLKGCLNVIRRHRDKLSPWTTNYEVFKELFDYEQTK
jgi:hypothetical protein